MPYALAAPRVYWASEANIASATFHVFAPPGTIATDTIYQEAFTDAGLTNTFRAGGKAIAAPDFLECEIDDFPFRDFSPDGTYYVRFCIRRSGVQWSEWSNTVSKTIATTDIVAPELSSPTDIHAADDSGQATVVTDTPQGTLYWVVSTSATPPTALQVSTGKMHTGAAAADSDSQEVTTSGTQETRLFADLTPATTYYTHFTQADLAGNLADVVTADGFTTEALITRAYTYVGEHNTSVGTAAYSFTKDIGPAAADRFMVLALAAQNTLALTSVLVAGTALNQDGFSTVGGVTYGFYSGLVTSGDGVQTIQMNYSTGAFVGRSTYLWRLTGLVNNAVKEIEIASGAQISIDVAAGDLLFAAGRRSGGFTYSAPTETPAAQRSASASDRAADWTVASANAAFSSGASSVSGLGHAMASYS